MTTNKRERVGYCCIYSLEGTPNERWHTDEDDLINIQKMIARRKDLVRPEIMKVTTTEEVIDISDTTVGDEMKSISEAIKEENGLCCEVIWSAMQHLKSKPTASIPEAIEYGFGEWIK